MILIILNIVLLEVILSIDNAVVMATMVNTLPKNQQRKALTYGILGAYLFRGLALLIASALINMSWLKVLGGVYLIYLCLKGFEGDDGQQHKARTRSFWMTVLSIEMMDLVFSIDNILASVSFTDSMLVIVIGVFIGMLAIRFATTTFIGIINKNPMMQRMAYAVIGMLGFKLALSYFLPLLNTEGVDLAFSVTTLTMFLIPLIIKSR
jgi:YkoY family integral membrane protein